MSMENPYASTAVVSSESGTSRKSFRTRATCILIAASFAMFIVCTFLHVCMCGHLAHATSTSYPFHISLDGLLGVSFLSIPAMAIGSHFRFGMLLILPLTVIYLDHVLLASGGGFLFVLLDLPIMISVGVLAIRRFRESKRLPTTDC